MESSGAPSRTAEEAFPNLSDQQVSDAGERVQGETVSRSLGTALPTSVERTISLESSASSTRKTGLPPRQTSARIKSSIRNQLPRFGFQTTDLTPQCDQAVLTQALFSEQQQEKTSALRPSSLTKDVSSVSAHRTRSLPVTQAAGSGLPSVQENLKIDLSDLDKEDIRKQIPRSFSLPGNVKSSLQQINSFGVLVCVMSANSHSTVDGGSPNHAVEANEATQEEGEDILEEEAICRICFLDFKDGRQVLKMECSCKGELALAHEECAVKWFSIKGNKTCDICKQDVKNLPVTLMRLQNPQTAIVQPPNALRQRQATHDRVCNNMQFLIAFSMLSYICFLELVMTTTLKKQASDTGTHILAISLPLGSILGFLSSMITSLVASGSGIWVYAFFQFAVVTMCAYIFYHVFLSTNLQLKAATVVMVLLSSFIGFGIAVSAYSLFRDYLSQRARWNLHFFLQQNVGGGNRPNSINNIEIENMDAPQQQEIGNNAAV
ncbi:uncharacterized protein LOC103717917 isoform X2 [Phoenix dactylifera]|uniref:Uncharacterized protein LOC103717917 isoform X2 n=1 Tax=Phoenix dactylifera TaxID=42345 RepID=A0A8B7CRC5_PHODC|nr:uncharacterized protein LOC103717917 isoform X2 [Phoenix dactylifera]